jgi:hypothetical protein
MSIEGSGPRAARHEPSSVQNLPKHPQRWSSRLLWAAISAAPETVGVLLLKEAAVTSPKDIADREWRRVWGNLLLLTATFTLILVMRLVYER